MIKENNVLLNINLLKNRIILCLRWWGAHYDCRNEYPCQSLQQQQTRKKSVGKCFFFPRIRKRLHQFWSQPIVVLHHFRRLVHTSELEQCYRLVNRDNFTRRDERKKGELETLMSACTRIDNTNTQQKYISQNFHIRWIRKGETGLSDAMHLLSLWLSHTSKKKKVSRKVSIIWQ
jgi:hypothetical protein